MKVTNRGYINFNNEYNKHDQDFTTASMSFVNGKGEDGNHKHGYIKVIAFGELGNVLYDNVGNLVTILGRYRQNEHEGNKYPQIIIDAINGYAPAQNQNNGNNGNFGQNQGQQTSFFQGQTTQTNPDFSRNFGNANPMDINEDDLPF